MRRQGITLSLKDFHKCLSQTVCQFTVMFMKHIIAERNSDSHKGVFLSSRHTFPPSFFFASKFKNLFRAHIQKKKIITTLRG